MFITFVVVMLAFMCTTVAGMDTLVIEYTAYDTMFRAMGTALDVCICNTTACKYVTATEVDTTITLVTTTYPGTACSGNGSAVTEDYPTTETSSQPCYDGSTASLTLTASIVSGEYAFPSPSVTEIAYSSTADCGSGVYDSFQTDVPFSCGATNAFTVTCEGANMTVTPLTSTSYQVTQYESAACSTVSFQETVSYPTACVASNGDDDNDDPATEPETFYQFKTVVVTGGVGSSSSDDDSISVNKGAYTALIVMVFVALGVGAGAAWCWFRGVLDRDPLKERLTVSNPGNHNV